MPQQPRMGALPTDRATELGSGLERRWNRRPGGRVLVTSPTPGVLIAGVREVAPEPDGRPGERYRAGHVFLSGDAARPVLFDFADRTDLREAAGPDDRMALREAITAPGR